jgi:hypothetical protein
MATTTATHENEGKRGGGTGQEGGGPVHCAKLEGGSAPSDIITGGAQGSDERDETETERTRGKNVLR